MDGNDCFINCVRHLLFGILIPAGFAFYTTLHFYGEWVKDATNSSCVQLLFCTHIHILFDQQVNINQRLADVDLLLMYVKRYYS